MKTIYKFLWVPAAFLFLQSCFVAKDYEEPDNIVQKETFRTDSISRDSTTIADVSWEDMFTDPLLQQYIDQALVNNIDIRVALQQIVSAEAYMKQGKAGYYPTLNADAQYSRTYFSDNGQQGASLGNVGTDHFDQYELAGNLSWEADIWGKIRSQKRAYNASYLQTVAAHKAVKTELIANVASAYYQLLSLDDQIAVTKQTIKTRKSSLETTKSLKESGLGTVTSAAVDQTEAQYLDAKAILVDLQKEAHRVENTLCILMGEEPHSIERTSLDDQTITTELQAGVPTELLRNRPDVIAAENNYRQAFEMTNVAKANFYPSLTISAGGGLRSMDIDDLFDTNSLFANIMGGLTAPIFNGRQIRTQYEVAQSEQEQARLDFRGTLIQASKEVSDALYDYQSASDKIDIKEDEQEHLDQAVDDTQELFKSGYENTSYLEVLTAQENALNSNLDLINARVDQLYSIINLYQAVGGGWK